MKKAISLLMSIVLLFEATTAFNITACAENIMSITIDVTYGQSEARTMLDMINELRTAGNAWYWNEDNTTKTTFTNLQPLEYDYALEKVAMQRAAELAILYSHTRPNGSTWFSVLDDLGYKFSSAAENIAYGYDTADEVYNAWAEEDEDYSGQGHRRNMLNSGYKAVAVGHAYYNGTHYWVQEFSDTVNDSTETTANDSLTSVTINADMDTAEHTFEMNVDVEPTCTEDGSYSSKTCTKCGYTVNEAGTIPKLGHKISAKLTYPATCGEGGYTVEICSRCDYKNKTYISYPTGNHSKYTITQKAPTCTQTGTATEKCNNCDYEKAIVTPATGHTVVTDAAKAATCTATGLTEGSHCSVCNTVIVSQDIIPATGHNFGSNSPTCLVCGAINPNYVAPTEPSTEASTEATTEITTEKATAPTTESTTTTTTSPTTTAQQSTAIQSTTRQAAQPSVPSSDTSKVTATRPTNAPTTTLITPSSTVTAVNTTTTTTAITDAKPSGATKIDGVWVNSKYKKTAIKKLKKGKKSFKVTWKKVSGVNGYQLQYSTSKKFTKKTTKSLTVKGNKAKNPSKTIKKLKSRKKYYVRVRTYKTVKVNGKSVKVYSKWSKVKSVKTK